MTDLKYIAVEGLVKSGKTKLARILAEEFKARLFLDNQGKPTSADPARPGLAGPPATPC